MAFGGMPAPAIGWPTSSVLVLEPVTTLEPAVKVPATGAA